MKKKCCQLEKVGIIKKEREVITSRNSCFVRVINTKWTRWTNDYYLLGTPDTSFKGLKTLMALNVFKSTPPNTFMSAGA